MGALSRTVSYAVAGDINSPSQLQKLLATRLLSLYGASAVLLLIRLSKLASPQERLVSLYKLGRNTSSLAIIATLTPIIRTLTKVKNPVLPWSAAVGGALAVATGLPGWLASYVAVESISDAAGFSRTMQSILSSMSSSSKIMARQALLCLLIPFFYRRTEGHSSAATRFLFNKRSLGRDFLLFYCIWNFLSVYRSLKSLLMDSKRDRSYRSQQYSSRQVDDWPMISSNLKPLMDRLGEMHELALEDSYSSFEKIMNSAIISNVMPCLKWALWRQLCVRTMVHKPPPRQKHATGARVVQSITLILGFFVLDGNNNKMNVTPGVLRYLLRCFLNTYLRGTNFNFQRLVTFFGSQLALKNIAQQLMHSK